MGANVKSLGVCGVVGLLWLAGCSPAELLDPGAAGLTGAAPAVAVRNGHALVVWQRSGIRVSQNDGAGWSAPQVLAPEGSLPKVAVAASGRALIAFRDGSQTKVATNFWNPVWPPAFRIDTTSSPPAYDVAVDTTDSGVMSVLIATDALVKERHPDRGGGIWSEMVLSTSGGALGAPRVVISNGHMFASWCGAGGVMFASHRVGSGTVPWGPTGASMPDCCQRPTLDPLGPGISLGAPDSGEAIVVGGTASRVCLMRFDPALGRWRPAIAMSAIGSDTAAPQIAVAPNGRALVAWHSTVGSMIRMRAFTPGTGLGPLLSGPIADPGLLGVGIGSGGNGAVVYRTGGDIHAVGFNALEGTLDEPIVVGSEPGTPNTLSVGFDPSKTAQGVSTWQTASLGGEQIWAARLGL